MKVEDRWKQSRDNTSQRDSAIYLYIYRRRVEILVIYSHNRRKLRAGYERKYIIYYYQFHRFSVYSSIKNLEDEKKRNRDFAIVAVRIGVFES